MEKRTPSHDLEGFRREFRTVAALRMTVTARNRAFELCLSLEDVVQVVQSMKRAHFYKSMTALKNHRQWQDVYHVPWQALTLYVKLTVDELGRLVLTLKEK